MRKLDIPKIFKSEAENIIKTREKAISIHGTGDIKAAGNEVEIEVRKFFKRMLPKNTYVTNGHIIDKEGNISPQLDVIIADNSNIPSLMTTKDETEYIPIESVYAIGEIKSTYYKSNKYFQEFSNTISLIKDKMHYEEIKNTAYMGKIGNNTTMRDIYLGSRNKYLNKLYTFIIFIDKGDFNISDLSDFYSKTKINIIPNCSIILNEGALVYISIKNTIIHERYPDQKENDHDYEWNLVPFSIDQDNSGSIEGNHLSFLYYTLINHISNSFLERPDFSQYNAKMMIVRKTKCKKL